MPVTDATRRARWPERTEADRFWEKVNRRTDAECWPWMAARNSRGYGGFKRGGKVEGAHRIAYEFAFGPIPEGMTVDHLCMNPPCVNAAHMRLLSMRDNILASGGESARHAAKSHCQSGHPFDESNTLISSGVRYCRACIARRSRERRARLKSHS